MKPEVLVPPVRDEITSLFTKKLAPKYKKKFRTISHLVFEKLLEDLGLKYDVSFSYADEIFFLFPEKEGNRILKLALNYTLLDYNVFTVAVLNGSTYEVEQVVLIETDIESNPLIFEYLQNHGLLTVFDGASLNKILYQFVLRELLRDDNIKITLYDRGEDDG